MPTPLRSRSKSISRSRANSSAEALSRVPISAMPTMVSMKGNWAKRADQSTLPRRSKLSPLAKDWLWNGPSSRPSSRMAAKSSPSNAVAPWKASRPSASAPGMTEPFAVRRAATTIAPASSSQKSHVGQEAPSSRSQPPVSVAPAGTTMSKAPRISSAPEAARNPLITGKGTKRTR